MNPREFQQLASKLANGNSPAEFRTAISRGYYAAYNVGVEALEQMGFRISEVPLGTVRSGIISVIAVILR